MNTHEIPSLAQRFPRRAPTWQLRTTSLTFDRIPKLMGIVNVTPNSFSDGGEFFSREAAVEQGLRLAADGADILDVGGESTRPYSTPVDPTEELGRVLPVVRGLCEQTAVPVSIDTSKSLVAKEAVAAGAQIINDVTGLDGDPEMVEVAAETSAGICVMHMLGSPQTMQEDPQYDDVVEDIFAYLRDRRDALIAQGFDARRMCLDPGIGFGKTHQHNLTLTAHCGRFHDLGCPILVGHSRKAFLGKILGDKAVDRTAATVGAALTLARAGIQVIRVHDVKPIRQALLAFAATGGTDGQTATLS
jgi:dihydropteroate synthase